MYKLVQGDITTLNVDVIVNAANSKLLRGGGVCGAIFSKAGTELDEECDIYIDIDGEVPTGSSVATYSYGIENVKAIIHSVGPRYNDGKSNEDVELASAYTSAVELAIKHRFTSIAFPFISSGIFGYPLNECSSVAHNTLAELSRKYDIEITLCLFSEVELNLFKSLQRGVTYAWSVTEMDKAIESGENQALLEYKDKWVWLMYNDSDTSYTYAILDGEGYEIDSYDSVNICLDVIDTY